MSSPISLNVTGLDTETLIQELMKLEKQPVVALEAKQRMIADRKAAWNALKGKIDSLMSKIRPLLGQAVYDAKVAKTSDPAVISATAFRAAMPGNYDVEVLNLAKAHTLQSRSFTQLPDEALGFSGKLVLSVGGAVGEIIIQGGENPDSLNSVAAKINSIEGLGITASVLEVVPSEYRLVLAAASTGQAISVEDEGSALGLATVEGREPAKAMFRINGITFERDSNDISDAVPGVSFNLLKAGAASVTVSYDDDALVKTVNELINEYNSLLDIAAKYNSWDSDTRKAGLLFGDPLLQRLLSQIRTTIFSDISGRFPGFRFVGAVGISTGSIGSYSRDGKLSLDESKFREALAENRDAVASLLGEDEAGSEGVLANLRQVLQMYVAHDGFLPLRDAQLESQDKDISRQIENLERRLQIRLMNLRRQFTALETLLMQMNSQGLWLAQQVQGLFVGD
ncbi:MAG TPA: flagellar filament capping protein FliD [Firmicutes bacterium]|nr:flagellar filament capping protein FliD [Candidatus Fermentithermobacillaceae bacterium]